MILRGGAGTSTLITHDPSSIAAADLLMNDLSEPRIPYEFSLTSLVSRLGVRDTKFNLSQIRAR
jgi:hypothetical protein